MPFFLSTSLPGFWPKSNITPAFKAPFPDLPRAVAFAVRTPDQLAKRSGPETNITWLPKELLVDSPKELGVLLGVDQSGSKPFFGKEPLYKQIITDPKDSKGVFIIPGRGALLGLISGQVSGSQVTNSGSSATVARCTRWCLGHQDPPGGKCLRNDYIYPYLSIIYPILSLGVIRCQCHKLPSVWAANRHQRQRFSIYWTSQECYAQAL